MSKLIKTFMSNCYDSGQDNVCKRTFFLKEDPPDICYKKGVHAKRPFINRNLIVDFCGLELCQLCI